MAVSLITDINIKDLNQRTKMEFVAPDERPTSLPPATLKAIDDAKKRGEYLQEVDCYWSPEETKEMIAFWKASDASMTDYRKRHSELDVADIQKKEQKVASLKKDKAILDKEIYKTFQIDNEKEREKIKSQMDKIVDELSYLQMVIKATKEWKPERRIVVYFNTNYFKVDETIAKINENKDKYPSLAPKLIQIINFRKDALNIMNKNRSRPMRNIHIEITLTPMDFKAVCSWTIRCAEHRNSWEYKIHYLHTTEYNLYGADVKAYKSREQLISEADKVKEKEKNTLNKALKKLSYDDYYLIDKHNINDNTADKIDFNSLIQDEHKKKDIYIFDFIVGNVDITNNTFEIMGYIKNEEVIKCSETQRITFKAKSARAKLSPLQKIIAKRNLTKNYSIDALL